MGFRMYFLYSLLLGASLLLSSPYWLWQMLRTGKHREGAGQRLGRVPPGFSARRTIWIHAVSVGEVLAVSGLVRELRARFPGRRVVVSTITATGQKLARERFGADVFYFPLDFSFAIRPWLRALRPELVVMAETEFWPNFLRLARGSGAGVAVINARISDRSLPRYRRFRRLMSRVLANIELFLAQTDEDSRRLIEIGARPERVRVSGNLKFDIAPPRQAPFATELKLRLSEAAAFPVLVCGSTVEGEELALLAMFQVVQREYPNAVMVLAPRHPERFEEVAALASTMTKCWRRSQLVSDAVLRGGVLLLDTIGELASVYSVATVALVGGSLVPRGGHNILEPAFFGVPILVGPHTENFRDIVQEFRARDAVREVRAFREGETTGDLSKTILGLIDDSSSREAMGRCAAATLQAQQGATERTLRALESLLAAGEPEATRR